MTAIRLILCIMLVAVSQAEPFIGDGLLDRTPGPDIAGALGSDRMDVVAKSYGMTARQLQEVINKDSGDIWLTNKGELFYACTSMHNHGRHRHLSEVIHLDFDGEVFGSSAYGGLIGAGTDIHPYDSDGKPYFLGTKSPRFDIREQVDIVTIWKIVADHFAPWNVDVTTEVGIYPSFLHSPD
eukprot:gene28384-31519_t